MRCPTVELAVEGGLYGANNPEATLADDRANSLGGENDVARDRADEGEVLLSRVEESEDRGYDEESRNMMNDRVVSDAMVTPSMGGAGNCPAAKTVFPPTPGAWSRPANRGSPCLRPANGNDEKQPVADSPTIAKLKPNVSAKVQVCTHLKGGVCTIHGPGAKLRWTPGKWVKGEKMQEKRNYFYVCEQNKKKKKNDLIQLKLNFPSRPDDEPKVEMTKNRREGE